MVSTNKDLVDLLNRHGSSNIKLVSPHGVRIHDGTERARDVSFNTSDEVEEYLKELAWVILQMSANVHAREAERHSRLQGEAVMEFGLLFGNP